MCFNLLIKFLACSLRGLLVMVLSTFSFQLVFFKVFLCLLYVVMYFWGHLVDCTLSYTHETSPPTES